MLAFGIATAINRIFATRATSALGGFRDFCLALDSEHPARDAFRGLENLFFDFEYVHAARATQVICVLGFLATKAG